MAHFLCQAVIPYKSGLPEDVAINTFVFSGDDTEAPPLDAGLLGLAVEHFYTSLGSTQRVGGYLAACVDRAANKAVVKTYDMTDHLDGSDMGPPVDVHPFTIPPVVAGGPGSFPEEVAACVSLKTNQSMTSPEKAGDTRPAARGRGRIYLGPLNAAASGVDANGALILSAEFRDNVLDACEALYDEAFAIDTGYVWVVWSRVGGSFSQVRQAWMDDRFDTQRRRGMAPTSRVLRDIS